MERIVRAVERCARFMVMLMVALGLVGIAGQGTEGIEHLAVCLAVSATAWAAGYGARSLRPAAARTEVAETRVPD